MELNRPSLFCIFLALLVYSSSACNPKGYAAIGDGGFISGKPCGAPCFYHIIPGITSETEVEKLLLETDVFSSCVKYDFTPSGGTAGYRCSASNIGINEGLVTGIEFLPSTEITMREVFDKYGEPQKIIVNEESLSEYPPSLSMRLIYSFMCMEIDTEIKRGLTYEMDAETKVAHVSYLSEATCKKAQELVEGYTKDWVGYGSYEP